MVTSAGREFADASRRILGLLEQARDAAVAQDRPEKGRLRVAAVTTAGEHVVPEFLATFRARHPAAEIVLEVGNRARVLDLLEHHEVDLVIGGRPPAGRSYVSLARRRNPLVVVSAQSGDPRPRARRPPVEQLAAAVWLLREPGSGTRATSEELFEQLGIAPRTLTLGSNGAVLQSARAGLGVTLVSQDAAARELTDGTLEEWRSPELPVDRSWHVVARGLEPLPATAGLFVDVLVSGPGRSRRRFHREGAL